MFKTKKPRPAALPESEVYTSTDVARISGVSLRQLQWWDERNVVSPRQDGHKRVYMAQEVVEISVIAELRRKGFSLQKIRRERIADSKELRALEVRLQEVNDALWKVEDDLRACERRGEFDRHFVELARTVYLKNDERAACKRRINELLGSSIREEKSY